jgi:hypothetical protein
LKRIPLTLRKYEGAERLLASAWVRTRLSRLSRPIILVVDTGSFISTIAYKDALWLQTSMANLRRISSPRKLEIGAGPIWGYPIETTYQFRTTENVKIKLDFVSYVLVPYSNAEKHLQIAEHIPSIIGLDFLKYHKLKFSLNPAGGEYYLELEESDKGQQDY